MIYWFMTKKKIQEKKNSNKLKWTDMYLALIYT